LDLERQSHGNIQPRKSGGAVIESRKPCLRS
jgi:hypothetical protein